MTEQTAESIAKAAYNGHQPEGFCDLTDYHLHTCLMQLYADFRENRISKEKAEAMKLKLVAAWRSDKDTEARWQRVTQDHAEAIRKVHGFNPEKAKSETECIAVLAQMISALTGDSSLPARLKKQFGE